LASVGLEWGIYATEDLPRNADLSEQNSITFDICSPDRNVVLLLAGHEFACPAKSDDILASSGEGGLPESCEGITKWRRTSIDGELLLKPNV
jgi:hypothetical protein